MKGIKQFTMVAGLGGVLMLGACSNPTTPAGSVGYVTKDPMIGNSRFYELQTGPSSTGLGWMLNVMNVGISPYNINEDFSGTQKVLSKDNLLIGFSAHIIFQIRPDQVQNLIEHYNAGATQAGDYVIPAYQAFLQQEFRKIAREQIKQYDGLDININEASSHITSEVQTFVKNTPFKVLNAVVGNIQYPTEVANAVSAKLASTQVLARKQTEVDIAVMEAKKQVAQAHGIADSMSIINNELNPEYLQYKAIEAQEETINSPNHTTIYIPVGNMGVPLTGTFKSDGSKE